MRVFVVSFENVCEVGGGVLGVYMTEAKAKLRARNYMRKNSKSFVETIVDTKAKFFVLEDEKLMVIVELYKIIK